MTASTDSGVTFLHKDVFVDKTARNLFGAVNCQLMPDGGFVFNECYKDTAIPYFNNVYQLDKNRTIIKHLEVPSGMDHECIIGTNTPRYYSPAFDYTTANDHILYITKAIVENPSFADEAIIDNVIVESDWNGNVLWQWSCAEHFEEFAFTEEEKDSIRNHPIRFLIFGKEQDWMHLNSVCCVGANQWYDKGDIRFHPENLICCSRNRSVIFIISKETGEIVWELKGMDLEIPFEVQHYAHIIPKGLEGAGNLLFFDSGEKTRDYSRVIELNPITQEMVFEYRGSIKSNFKSSVQKLTDGNYLIASSDQQMITVVRPDKEIVQECKLDEWFYRVNAYPAEWFHEHDYTEEQLAAFDEVAETELKTTSSILTDLYAEYLNVLISEE